MNVPPGISSVAARGEKPFRAGSLLRCAALVAAVTLAPGWPERAQAAVHGSPFYEFRLVARVGSLVEPNYFITDLPNDTIANQPPFSRDVSLNNAGRVAFGAKTTVDGSVVGGDIVVQDLAAGTLIGLSGPCGVCNFTRAQINDDNWLITQGTFLYPEIWNANAPGTRIDITEGLPGPCPGCRPYEVGLTARAHDGTAVVVVKIESTSPYSLYRYFRGTRSFMAHANEFFLYPTVANGGAVIVKDGRGVHGEMVRFDADHTRRVLASTAANWTALGTRPGMSPDGTFMAWVGQHALEGNGIFLAASNPANPNITRRLIAGGDLPITYDELGNPITFSAFNYEGRVAVVHHDVGNDGNIDGDTVIIAFVATPSRASAPNTAAPTKPLLFSEKEGIWTVRVDVRRELLGTAIVLNPNGVLPVIQIDDYADGERITNIDLRDGLGRATADWNGTERSHSDPSDHYLAFWVDTTGGPMILKAGKLDMDGDGLPDHWERPGGGIDMDRDGTVDLALHELGAKVDRKDLFLEVDWLAPRTNGFPGGWRNQPHPGVLQRLAHMFTNNVPVSNPDGSRGIKLHIDAGRRRDAAGRPFSQNMEGVPAGLLQGGNEVSTDAGLHPDVVSMQQAPAVVPAGLVFETFHKLKDRYFGLEDKRARELAFRYAILADFEEAVWASPIGGQLLQVKSAIGGQLTSLSTLDANGDGSLDIAVGAGDALLVTSGVAQGQVRSIDSVNVNAAGSGFTVWLVSPLDPQPAPNDQFAILKGHSGRGEVFFYDASTRFTANNQHTLPGNDFVSTLGGWGPNDQKILGDMIDQWRTMAHELGHTLGLRHGGNRIECAHNGDDFWSVMSYTHQLRVFPLDDLKVGGQCPGYPKPGHISLGPAPCANCYWIAEPPGFASPGSYFAADPNEPGVIQSYSDGNDPLGFNDWGYTRKEPYAALWYVGNTWNKWRGVHLNPHRDDYQTFLDSSVTDREAPFITLLSPAPRTAVPLGADLQVAARVSDDGGVESVIVRFDLDGDGAEGEVTLPPSPDRTYTVSFRGVGGPEGVRSVEVVAFDRFGNVARLAKQVLVGSEPVSDTSGPFPIILSPPSSANIATDSWLAVEINAFDPQPDVVSVVVSFDADGDGVIEPGETVLGASTRTNFYSAIFRELSGPLGLRMIEVVALDGWMNSNRTTRYVNIIAADYTPPEVAIISPAEEQTLGLGEPLRVELLATDNQVVRQVSVSFDFDGNGVPGVRETLIPTQMGSNRYVVIFEGPDPFVPQGVSGPEGVRTIRAEAVDLAGSRVQTTRNIRMADLLPPSILFSSPAAGAAVRLGAAFAVDLKVRDDQRVDEVVVSFDLNGDGATDDAGEVIAAVGLGGENFRASFGNVTGSEGPRAITGTARDPTMKTNTARQTVNVATAAVVQRPLSTDVVNSGSTFHVQLEVVPGLNVGQVNVSFDINGDGTLDGPGERTQALPADIARQYLASFSNVGGSPGPRSIFIDVIDPAGTTTNSRVQTVEVGSFGGFAGLVSRKLAAVPFLPEAGSGAAEDFMAAGPYLFFTANDQIVGRELWRTDGTPEGTILLGDINPDKVQSGAAAGQPLGAGIEYLTAFGNQVFFAASDWHGDSFSGFQPAAFGRELWKSDGTVEGTVMVKDINPGRDESMPEFLTVFQGCLFFAAYDEVSGRELWKSDGSIAGTMLFKDINSGLPGSGPENLTVVGGMLFFAANLSQLWKSDGTPEGTIMVKDIYPGGGASGTPRQLVAVNGRLFFTANDGTNGWELWTSDGTESGTVMVKDIYPGLRNGSYPESLTAWNGALYFTATNSEFGRELWKSDGTEAGTILLRDISPGIGGSLPADLVEFNGHLFFSANDGANGRELWKTDGTTNGTVLAVNLAPYSGPPPTDSRMIYPMRSSSPVFLTVYNGALYFRADDGTGTHGSELWRSDGTPEGTMLVRDIAPGSTRPIPASPSYIEPKGSRPGPFYIFGGELYFNASDHYGLELWKTDGTAAGTRRVRNITHDAPPAIAAGGSALYHQGSDGLHGSELWQSTSSGTAMLKDLNPGASNSFPAQFKSLNDQMLLSTSNGLWKTDGTAAGTVRLQSFAGLPDALFGFVELNSALFFSAANANGYELWKTDGTAPGTTLVKDLRLGGLGSLPIYPEIIGSQVLFQASDGVTGRELWRTDGTSAGTLMLSNINAGAADSNPGKLTAYSGAIIFAASSSGRGYELWRTDGTGPGTMLVKDIRPGSSSSFDSSVVNFRRRFTSFNGALFFSANDGVNGYELWKTDGTMTGTVLVKDINDTGPGQDGRPENWTAVRDTLFFSADSRYSIELWKTDGTTAGTVLVKNIRGRHPTQGYEQASSPQDFTELNGALFFTAWDDDHGRELWRSDGTAFGTVMLRDIFPGQRSSDIRQLAVVTDRLFFVANDGAHGHELWTSDGTFDGTHLVEDLLPGPGSASPSSLSNTNDRLHYFANHGADDLSLRELAPAGSTLFRRWLDSVAELSGPDAQLGADPDGDGLSNIAEHELGSDPDDPLSDGPVILSATMFVQDFWTYLDVTYTRRRDALAHGLRYWAERSRDLEGWLLMQTVSETVRPLDDSFDSVVLRVRTPVAQLGFVRLAVGVSP